MTPLRYLGGALLLAMLTESAHGATLSGIDLAEACRSTDEPKTTLCRAFVGGFISGSQVNFNGLFFSEWRYGASRWCFDDATDDETLIAAFVTYVQANRSELHFPAATLFAKAMAARYACN